MEIKVYTNNTVEVIAWGEGVYRSLCEFEVINNHNNRDVHSGVSFVKDTCLEPNQFIGLDSENEWVFSYGGNNEVFRK